MTTFTYLNVSRRKPAKNLKSTKQYLLLMLFLACWNWASAQTTYTTTSTNTWSTQVWSPAGTPGPSDHVVINHNIQANVAVTISNLTVNAARTLTITSANFTANGTTTVNGILTDNNNTGTNTFGGLVTVNAGGSFNTANNSPYVFGGGISNAGTFSKTGTGAITFSNSTSVGGSAAITLSGATVAINGNTSFTAGSNISFNGTITLGAGVTVSNSATIASTGALNGTNSTTSIWNNLNGANLNYGNVAAPMATGVLNASEATNTVNYNLNGAQTIKSASYHTLTLSAGGTKTSAGAIDTEGPFNLNAGVTFNTASFDFDAGGTSTIAGTFNDQTTGGLNLFRGPVVVTGSITNLNTITHSFEFQNGISLSMGGSVNIQNLGTTTFSSNSQALALTAGTGSMSFVNVTISGDITLTNNVNSAGGLTIRGNLDGNSVNATFLNNFLTNYLGANEPMVTGGNLNASPVGNTFNYAGSVQTVNQTTYHHLGFTASGNKSIGNITVNGNFTRSNGTLIFTGTQTFGSSTAAFLNTNANLVFSEILVAKPGSTLTLNNTGTITTTQLTVASGSFVFGTGGVRTVTLSDDLDGAGNINLSGAAHILNLGGAHNSIGSLTTDASASNINYNRTGSQEIFSSLNYRVLTLSGSGIKTIGGSVKVNTNLNMTTDGCFLNIDDSDLKIGGTATLTGSFSANRYIITDGTGRLFKEGASTTELRSNMVTNGLFPVGSGGYYTPYQITALNGTVVGTAAIMVRAVSSRQPNVPYFNNALTKYWEIETANLTVTSANTSFTFNSAEVIGSVTGYVPRVWRASALSAISSPATPSAPGSNPFTVLNNNYLAGEWTAIDPTVRAALYSYQSGDWGTANTWTTDPSGNTLVSPMVPGAGDQVVILNGRTVTTTVARTVGSVTINAGGTLDLGNSTGHSFGPLAGEGRMRLSTLTLPTANYNNFVAANGGTIEYYNLGASPLTLSTSQTTYNHLEIRNSTSASQTLILNSNLTVNGNFSISRTGTGNITFTTGGDANSRTLAFQRNVTVGNGCTWNTGNFNATHTITIVGSLENSGSIDFTNGSDFTTSTTGCANVTFTGTNTNTEINFNAGSSTTFFGFSSNKATGYELSLIAAPTATVNFVNQGYTVYPTGNGILRLGNNITIPRLIGNASGNYDIGSPSFLPVFWIDGASVTYNASGAIVPYGTLKITSGTLTCQAGQGGIVIRESGLILVEGGTVNARMIRTSVTATTHRGTYIQTGGTITLTGDNGMEQGFYAVFSLPYSENVFKMSGGTMNITRTNTIGTITPNGGFLVGSHPLNSEVTGGTINISTTANVNFDITSRAAFWNLNLIKATAGTGAVRITPITWSFSGSPANQVTVPAYPLVVLNNLTIQNGALNASLLANGNNINCAGNFTIQAGANFTPGANTITFDGVTDQTFSVASGSISGNLNHITINKALGQLTLAGTVTTLQAAGNLSILSGTFNDGGKTLSVAGNIINNSTHSGTGKIQLNSSTAAQSISGNGNGVFANLDLANTFGTAGSTQITLLDPIQVNGVLTLSTDRLFFLSIYKLTLGTAGNISAGSGAFGPNRFIRTQGYLSDGGISKTYSAGSTSFIFPFGTGSNYTPATISFGAAPTTWGTLDVRPVTARQLYVTDLNCFEYYWKVNQTGFTGIPANSVSLSFNYGNLTDNTAYIPGYYNYQTIAYTTINNVNAVDETANRINFSSWSQLQGDYTAGIPACFGTVIPYYSRANGNWNTATTWSNVGFGGTPSSTIPSSSVPVFIGDGNTFNHTVNVTTNNTVSGSLVIANGSTLDLGVTTGNNFGALPYSTAGGNGKIRISSSSSTAQFPAGDFGLFFLANGGTTEYYGGTSNFTIPLITAAPTSMEIRSYRHLQLSPSAAGRISLPNYSLDIFGDLSINGATSGSEAATNDVSARTITVNGNMTVNSGNFRFTSAANQALIINGNLTVASGASMNLNNASSRLHSIELYGNLVNNGVIDFDDSNADLQLSLLGSFTRNISGTNPSASIALHKLIINKGSDQSNITDFTMLGTITTNADNWLQIDNGTFRFSRAGTLTLTSGANVTYTLPSSARLSLNHASGAINIGMNNSNGSDFILGGTLEILEGTVQIGSSTYTSHNDIEYTPTDYPTIDVRNSGMLLVNGQIRRSVFSLQGGLRYYQSGNSTVIVRGKNNESAGAFSFDRAKFEILNENSVFSMADNSLLVIDRNGLANTMFGDIYLDPASFSLTGGEVRIGTTTTPAASVFALTSTSPFWNLSIDGTTTSKTCNNLVNATTIMGNLRIEGNSIFNANGLDITIGGNLINQNTTSATGIAVGGYRPGSASQTTYLNGSSGNQTITGVNLNLTNFANLVVSNTYPAGTITCTGSVSAVRVNGSLTLSSGNLLLEANNFTAVGNISSNVTTSNTTGWFIVGGAAAQSISGNGNASFGNFRMANSAGAELTAPLRINGALNFVQGLLYINNHLLTLGESATITGTINSSNMIRVNGVISDAGVRKFIPASASDFTFQMGTTLKHTPARFNITSNSVAGSITVKPVGVKHPATTDPLNKELTYYWSVTKTGLSPSITVDQYYTYHPNDAINGNEAAYVTGRYFNNQWTPGNGISGTVDDLNDNITLLGVSYVDGDYTAGEAAEFGVIQTYFSRNATSGGNWNDVNSWSTDATLQHAGPPCATPPTSNNIVIASGHTITCQPADNNKIAPISVINGLLNLNATNGHNLGIISGTGTIRVSPNGVSQFIIPGGDYTQFTSNAGGTIEYNSNWLSFLPLQSVYNNVSFIGSGGKVMANTNLIVNGDFLINQGVVSNGSNVDILLRGNWENQAGFGGWSQGSGRINLDGTNQHISGSTSFSNLNVNGGGIKTLYSTIYVTNLQLTNGIISTGSNEVIIPHNGDVTDESAVSYINGNLRKNIPAAALSAEFEIGDANHYTPVSISFTGTVNAGGNILAKTTAGDHTAIYTSGINEDKSANRTWQLTATSLSGFVSYSASFNFVGSDLDAGTNPLNFSASRFASGSWNAISTYNAYNLYTSVFGLTSFGTFQLGEPMNGIIWTGAISTNWNNAANWLPLQIPGATDDIFIGPVTNQPNFTSGTNGICRNMNLESGVRVSIPSTHKIQVYGDINSTNALISGTGTLQYAASSGQLNGNLNIDSHFEITSGSILTLDNDAQMVLARDLNVYGQLNTNNQTVSFVGGQNSVIRGNKTIFEQLIVSKQSDNLELTLNANAEVNGNINLIMGDINLNGKEITLGANASILGETTENRVFGNTGTITTTRNLNAPSELNVAGLGIELTSSANLGSTTITRGHTQKVFNAGFGINRYYDIHPTNNSGLDATLKFNYFEDELNTSMGSVTEVELDLWRFDGAVWNFQWATVDMANNQIVKTDIPQFSTWTAGSRENNALPITLTEFNAECAGDQIYANWVTASESNNKEFRLEASDDALTWKTLQTIQGAGNSNTSRNYDATVKSPFAKASYVRLRQIDFNGKTEVFDPVYVSCEPPVSNEILLSPNPATSFVDVQFKSETKADVILTIFSSAGQILLNSSIKIEEGSSSVRLDVSALPAGVYHLNISNNKKIEFSGSRSIIKR